jgi:O-acetyl-ADP-ribose deacetylase (regulator of RNase III)
MKKKIRNTVVELVTGDLTEMRTDAIVNAANSLLAHGGGVAGAISQKGGPTIQEESDLWVRVRGPVLAGSCAITSAGRLPTRYVIHAVGPRMGEGDEEAKLRLATLSSLETAEKHHLQSIAFPAVSTGIFGYPLDRCADGMLSTVIDYANGETRLERIVFCLYDQKAFDIFKKKFKELIDF